MTMQITRKKFLDLGLGTLGAIGLGACGSDDSEDTGNDTGTSNADADATNTDPTMPTTNEDGPDDADASATVDPSDTSSGPSTDPTVGDSSTDAGESDSGTETTVADSSTGPGDGSSTGTAEGCNSDPTATFDLHAHTLTIPLADVMAGVEQTYVAGGGHTHDVTVTAADFAELQAGNEVVVTSSFDVHAHMVTLVCR